MATLPCSEYERFSDETAVLKSFLKFTEISFVSKKLICGFMGSKFLNLLSFFVKL